MQVPLLLQGALILAFTEDWRWGQPTLPSTSNPNPPVGGVRECTMAIISTVKYRQKVRPVEQVIMGGGLPLPCPQSTGPSMSTLTTDSYDASSSPSRPDRRPKPECLRCSLTARGPFSQQTVTSRVEKHVRFDTITCSGNAVPRTTIRWRYGLASSQTPDADWPSTALQLRNMIKGRQVSMADSIGEYRDSCRAVAGGARALRDAAKFVARMRRQPLRAIPWQFRNSVRNAVGPLDLDKVNGLHLATRFGILPWMQLAQDSLDALQRRGQEITLVHVFRATARSKGSSTIAGEYGGEASAKIEKTVNSVAYVTYFRDIGTFTAGNPLEALWAGLPASFMVDWFYNVGAYLSAIDALDGVRSVYGSSTMKSMLVGVDKRIVNLGFTEPHGVSVIPGRFTKKTYQRSALSLAMPSAPEWKPTPSWGKLASALSVLRALHVRGR